MRPLFMLVGLLACTSSDAQLRFEVAPGAEVKPSVAAVYGVYRDGRMDVEAWDRFSKVVASLGTCPAAFTQDFSTRHPESAKAVSEYARTNGFTDELFAQLAPGTDADAIVLLQIAGKTPRPIVTENHQPAASPSQTQFASPLENVHAPVGNAFDIAVAVYSTKQHRSIASLDMTYTGQDPDEAVRRFADAFKKSFPGWTCANWKPEVVVDPEAIQRLK